MLRYTIGIVPGTQAGEDDITYTESQAGNVVFYKDILPVLRMAREVAEQCMNFQPNYSDSAKELLDLLEATKGVEG